MQRTRCWTVWLVALWAPLAGCARPSLPDPRDTAREYAEAVARGDAERVHALLTRSAQRDFGREGTARRVREERSELSANARALAAPGARVEATATIPLRNGDDVELSLEDDGFRVDAAQTLPSAARTPAEALEGLRQALGRRSYAALLRVLSAETRFAIESDLRALAAGLGDPKSLDVKVTGDRAEVELPGGHSVRLKREAGIWRVDDLK